MKQTIQAVLFDLDGTLLDTAPDLGLAINTLLNEYNHPPLPFTLVRPLAGHGGKGLIKAGFKIDEQHPNFIEYWEKFLTLYSENICHQTQLFPGMEQVLNYLTENHLPWGIVTNKPRVLTELLLQQLHLTNKAACIVSGDTLPQQKPHPAPLLHACALLNVLPKHCVYVGDAERDIQAGKSAGMHTLIAKWGYIADTDPFDLWQADAVLEKPEEIVEWLDDNC
jgi:N-acetyl-D-muramate 6-phosphate phosphatase